jgi:hypothetical protein
MLADELNDSSSSGTQSTAYIPLPGTTGWHNQMRPYRTAVYLLLDLNYRLLGHHCKRYAQRAIWLTVAHNVFQ